jgi:NAD(P)-dependent dehydrogenase (short-subunit alcohol dehydrogenase family)
MVGRLEGKIAVVTGAGTGMGEAITKRFCEEGATVIAADKSGEQDSVAESIGNQCIPMSVDVSCSQDIQAMFAFVDERYGSLDVLCNNAGIQGPIIASADYPEEAYEEVMAVNSRGVFLGMRYGLPLMLKSGGGSIVNTASMASVVAFPQLLGYCASKGAVRMMTKAVAIEYADQGIRVNCFCPGSIMTNMLENMPEEYVSAVIEANPVKRVGLPKEIADLALFLASAESTFITGTEIMIDGGYTAL